MISFDGAKTLLVGQAGDSAASRALAEALSTGAARPMFSSPQGGSAHDLARDLEHRKRCAAQCGHEAAGLDEVLQALYANREDASVTLLRFDGQGEEHFLFIRDEDERVLGTFRLDRRPREQRPPLPPLGGQDPEPESKVRRTGAHTTFDLEHFQPKALRGEVLACMKAMTPEEQGHACAMLDRLCVILNGSASPVDFARQLNAMLGELHDSHATLPGDEWYAHDHPRLPPLARPVQDGVELDLYIGRDPCLLFRLSDEGWNTRQMLIADYIDIFSNIKSPRYADLEREDAPGLIWWELINCWDSVVLST